MSAEELFEKHGEEYLKFDRVENKRSQRKDLHAFILLDELFPDSGDIVDAAAHDEFWLSISNSDIESLSEERVLELVRCGVMLDGDSLHMAAI